MQKKFLSILLTAAITLSLFAAIPFGAAAETASNSNVLTFDTQAQLNYYGSENNAAYIDFEETGDSAHGTAAKFEKIGGPYKSWWLSAIRLAQIDENGVSAATVIPGKTYQISFDYKVETITHSWSDFYFKLHYVSSGNSMGNYMEAAGKAPATWELRSSFSTSLKKNTQGAWITYTAEFTVPTNIGTANQISFVPYYGDGDFYDNQAIWFDNFSVELIELKGTAVTDFETEAQRTFHGKESNSTVTIGQPTGETGYAANFGTIIGPTNDKTQWNSTLRITMNSNGDVRPVVVDAGSKYNISFKIKAEKLDVTVTDFYICYITNSNSGYFLKVNYDKTANDYSPKITFKNSHTAEQMMADWITYSFDFTVPEDIGDKNQLALFPIAANGWQTGGQTLWIDDVAITKYATVTAHNASFDDFTVYPVYGGTMENVTLPIPSVKAVAWYKDAARTIPFTGTVDSSSMELWADLVATAGDFDNGNIVAVDPDNVGNFVVKEYIGVNNSNAIISNRNLNNGDWPPAITLTNPDGTTYKTTAGHNYTLSFNYKVDDINAITKYTSQLSVGSGYKAKYSNDTAHQLYNDSYKAGSGFNYCSLSFTASENKPVYITAFCLNTPVTIDNIKIIDETAQLAITDGDGNVLAKGYDGEAVVIPDAEDADFVYYADENGNPVYKTTVRKAEALTKVNSQIAVTNSVADTAKQSITFETRFGGMGYETGNSGAVTVKTVTVGGKKYLVEDMGLLVAPAANGEPTLGDLKGGTNISGSDLKYSASGENELTLAAQISVNSKYDRDYTVVGYIKCVGGKVVYSKMRSSIAKNYNAVTGIETTDITNYTATISGNTYKLVSNSEFNSAESLSGAWNVWGSSTDKNGVKYYSVDDAVYTKDGNLNLNLTKTSATSYEMPEVLSNQWFTHGYVEIKAQFANVADLGGALWFNSVGIKDDDLVIKPDSTSHYVKPEIDMVEFGNTSSYFVTLHNWGTSAAGEFGEKGNIRLCNLSTEQDYTELNLTESHIYGIERTADFIRMYVDGVKYYELTYTDALSLYGTTNYYNRTEDEVKALFNNPTYLILGTSGAETLNVGQNAVSTVDYVRFYK